MYIHYASWSQLCLQGLSKDIFAFTDVSVCCRHSGGASSLSVWMSALLGGLSMLAKETGVTVMLVNLAYDLYRSWHFIKRWEHFRNFPYGLFGKYLTHVSGESIAPFFSVERLFTMQHVKRQQPLVFSTILPMCLFCVTVGIFSAGAGIQRRIVGYETVLTGRCFTEFWMKYMQWVSWSNSGGGDCRSFWRLIITHKSHQAHVSCIILSFTLIATV